MKVNVTVKFTVDVPDETDPKGLCVEIGSMTFQDLNGDGNLPVADETDILEYETTEVKVCHENRQ